MRKLAYVAAAAVLCLSWSVRAQQQVVTSSVTASVLGGLTNSGDAVPLSISGAQFATAKFTAITAGTSTVTAQVSIDGGTNWLAAPYAKRISTASANPTVQAITATTLVTGDTWEIPLPGNTTNVQLVCAGTGTVTAVKVQNGAPYVPGVPVVATLYDVTSGVNAANNTGTLEASGWNSAWLLMTASGGVPAFAITPVDDAGTSLFAIYTATAVNNQGQWGLGAATGNELGAFSLPSQLPKRLALTSAAIAAQTSRIRIEVRR